MSKKDVKINLRKQINAALANVKVSGVAKIIDKDGNVKSEMEIVGLEVNKEVIEDAIK